MRAFVDGVSALVTESRTVIINPGYLQYNLFFCQTEEEEEEEFIWSTHVVDLGDLS